MSKFTDAADAIKRQLKTMEQWAFAASVLEEIGSLDNASKEVTAAIEKVKVEHKEALADLAKSKDESKKVKDKVAAALATAEAEAEQIVNEAKEKASGVEAIAKGKAEEIIELAKANASAITSEAVAQRTRIVEELTTKMSQLNDTNVALADAETKLAQANKQLDMLKSKLSALVG